MRVQVDDLNELLQANGLFTEAELRRLVAKSIRHYEEYYERRRSLVPDDGPAFFCPSWCNSFENAFLWIGGCRPSMFIRLLYSLSCDGLEDHLASPSSNSASAPALVTLSSSQLGLVNDLHKTTLREEDRIASQMATLQESVADRPLFPIVNGLSQRRRSGSATAPANAVAGPEAALEEYAEAVARMVGEADRLRVNTARMLLSDILTPRQAVELLTTAKQLHLSVHQWGDQRDQRHGHNPS